MLTADPRISSSGERLRGFRRAMEERGVEIDPALVVEMDASASDSVQKIEEILASGLDFTAIFAFSDYIAWETIYALNSHGVRVPEDVSIVGFDDVQSHMRFPPPLTSVHFPKRTVSIRSVEILLEQIRRGGESPVQQVLDAHLVVRGSTAAPRKRGEG